MTLVGASSATITVDSGGTFSTFLDMPNHPQAWLGASFLDAENLVSETVWQYLD